MLRLLTRDPDFRLFPDKPCGPGDRGKLRVSIRRPGTLSSPSKLSHTKGVKGEL